MTSFGEFATGGRNLKDVWQWKLALCLEKGYTIQLPDDQDKYVIDDSRATNKLSCYEKVETVTECLYISEEAGHECIDVQMEIRVSYCLTI